MKAASRSIGVVLACALLAVAARAGSTKPAADTVSFEMALYFLAPPRIEIADRVKRLQTDAFRDLPTLAAQGSEESPGLRFKIEKLDRYAPPDEPSMKYFGRGLTPEQAKKLQSAPAIWVFDFSGPRKDALRTVARAGQFMLEATAGDEAVIWDEHTREVFTPEVWKKSRVEGWVAGVPDVSRHITIHYYVPGDDKLPRAITLGMAKFGCPDVVVNAVPRSSTRSCGSLMNAICQSMVEKGPPAAEMKQFPVDFEQIQQADVKKRLMGNPAEGARHRADVGIGAGKHEDGDPNNALIQLTFEGSPGKTLVEREEALLGALFGVADSLTRVKHDDELLAARDRARGKILEKMEAFNKGLPLGDHLLVKAPFKTPDGGDEWMWVEVIKWDGDQISGILQNRPFDVPELKSGSDVTVRRQDLFDYIHRHADGSIEGNETGKIMEKREKAGQ